MDISDQDLSPAQRDFLAYWRRQAGSRIAPRRADFDVLDVPLLMPYAIIFDVLADPLDFRYRLIGTVQREMSNRDYTGMKMSEIDGRGPDSGIWSILDRVRTSREPAYHSIAYVGPKKDYMKLNDLFLPWLGDDETTSMVIIVSCYLPK
ncbi:MAG: PAS domain-containing protein [Rhodospirillales bacterium]|nr:MAG: PAS domain-containing protein [Rhodospirillales bacterium]